MSTTYTRSIEDLGTGDSLLIAHRSHDQESERSVPVYGDVVIFEDGHDWDVPVKAMVRLAGEASYVESAIREDTGEDVTCDISGEDETRMVERARKKLN